MAFDMKIIVLTDIHANLPALQAALQAIRREGYDELFHVGDAIAIGPHPGECMALLRALPAAHFIMGNHDAYFAKRLPAWMEAGELAHQHWTHAQLAPDLRAEMAQWPYQLHMTFAGWHTYFAHYALDASGQNWLPIVKAPTVADLDAMFAPVDADLIFYGHHHPFADVVGRVRTINPGSLGCCRTAVARFTVVDFQPSGYRVQHRAVAYDDAPLVAAFKARQVPERAFLNKAFFGGRLGV